MSISGQPNQTSVVYIGAQDQPGGQLNTSEGSARRQGRRSRPGRRNNDVRTSVTMHLNGGADIPMSARTEHKRAPAFSAAPAEAPRLRRGYGRERIQSPRQNKHPRSASRCRVPIRPSSGCPTARLLGLILRDTDRLWSVSSRRMKRQTQTIRYVAHGSRRRSPQVAAPPHHEIELYAKTNTLLVFPAKAGIQTTLALRDAANLECPKNLLGCPGTSSLHGRYGIVMLAT